MARRPPVHPSDFTVLIDTREQAAWTFDDIYTNADQGSRPIAVKTVRTCLKHGDYSVLEHPDICIERKSKADFYSSMSTVSKRSNWEARLSGMNALAFSAVVVESEISDIIESPPRHTRFPPKSAIRTVIAWQVRYPTRWIFLPGREVAGAWAYRTFEFWHRGKLKESSKKESA